MMDGLSELPKARCPECKVVLRCGETGTTSDEGKWKHEHCWLMGLKKEGNKLKKKFDDGTITLAESNRMQDIILLLENHNRPQEPARSPKSDKRTFPINRVRFGKRVDTDAMIESGEISKSKEISPITGKPVYFPRKAETKHLMPAVYAVPSKKILPYKKTKKLSDGK